MVFGESKGIKNGLFGRHNGGLGWLLRVQIIGFKSMTLRTEVVADVKVLKKAIWDMV